MFKRQACIVQVVFDKEHHNGLGGAEGRSSLSGFGVKKRVGLGSCILESEDGGVQGLVVIVRKGMAKSMQVGVGDKRASEVCLQEPGTGGVGGGKELGGWLGSSQARHLLGGQRWVLTGRRILPTGKPRGEGCSHQRLACIPLAECHQGPSHCPPHSVSVAQHPWTQGES